MFLRGLPISKFSNKIKELCMVASRPVARRELCKQRPLLGNTRNNRRAVVSVGPCPGVESGASGSPASRRRRRKGNPVPGVINGPSWGTWSSRFGEFWNLLPDSGPRMTALVRASSNCKPHHLARDLCYIRTVTSRVQLKQKIAGREAQGA
jgi:hypothetical protein